MHTRIHTNIFLKSSLQKHDLRTWHWHCKLDFCIGAYLVLEKSSSHKHIYIYIYSLTPVMCCGTFHCEEENTSELKMIP